MQTVALEDGHVLGLDVAILDDPSALQALRAEWEALLGQAAEYSAAQTIEYVLGAWEALPKAAGARLRVIVVRRGGLLACVWPLHVIQEGWKTVAYHLGCGGHEEYAGPLVRNDEHAAAVVQAALKAAKSVADLLKVFNLPVPGLAAEILRADPAPKYGSSVGSPVTSLKGFANWDAWAAGKSKSFRAGLRYERKRLSEQGDLRFREMSGPVDGPRCVDWLFAAKRAWLVERKVRRSWMYQPQGRDFFAALAARPAEARPASGDVKAFALTLDDKIIAASICFMSSDRIEFYTTTFDTAFAAYSPGSLLIQDCVTLAIAANLDFDFRITAEAYKLRWLDRYDRYDSFTLGCTPKGVAAVQVDRMWLLVHAFRVRMGPRIKGLLKRKSR